MIKQCRVITSLLFGVLLFSVDAQADLFGTALLSINSIYIDRDYDDNGVKSQSKNTDTDIRLQKIDRGWSYGLIYSQSANDASDASRTSYGVSAGYFSERDFYLTGHYFLSSKHRLGSGSEYTKGNGYQVDVGFLSRMNSSVYLGLGMAMKNFKYSELKSASGATSSTDVTHQEIVPYFTIAINFL